MTHTIGRPKAVSYTHLDVYKRQVEAGLSSVVGVAAPQGDGDRPVSGLVPRVGGRCHDARGGVVCPAVGALLLGAGHESGDDEDDGREGCGDEDGAAGRPAGALNDKKPPSLPEGRQRGGRLRIVRKTWRISDTTS